MHATRPLSTDMGIGVNMDTEHVKFASAGYMDTTIYIYINVNIHVRCSLPSYELEALLWVWTDMGVIHVKFLMCRV